MSELVDMFIDVNNSAPNEKRNILFSIKDVNLFEIFIP